MPKFMVKACYNAEGLKGLRRDKASGREKAITAACAALGGKLEAIYFALGDDDVLVIVDVASHVHAAKMAIMVGASGMFSRVTTVPLLTVAEADEALADGSAYRPPGG